ncbi:MAG TPA: helix-turn-helix transcriptional regulator [Rectinema sp.]|nr:helix-turn-helix transcriptional regulator [Rectinema sp.]HRU78734.1 helix-turn-helix transcriptional regulator [Rectinema sp.]
MDVIDTYVYGVESSERATTPSGYMEKIFESIFSSASAFSSIMSLDRTVQFPIEPIVSDKIRAIISFFGLSKSDLARILHVSRPSLYAWLKGQSEPGLENMRTIQKLYSLIEPSETGTWYPIFYGYIEKPFGAFKKSLIEALSEPELDEEEIRAMVKEIRQMSQKRTERLAESEAKSKVILSEESKKKILEDNLLSIYRGA